MYLHKCFTKSLRISLVIVGIAGSSWAQTDPGPRGGAAGAGGPIAGLTTNQGAFFSDGLVRFNEVDGVANGLGPRFNLDSCAGCHKFPAAGGSSPAINPQVSVAPSFQVTPLLNLGIIRMNGPVREVRFQSDGGVHDLFTIAGRSDAPGGCNASKLPQPDFAGNLAQLRFRIPTPTFGAGLIEAIPDATIAANAVGFPSLGITGHVNRNGNDGTITRFGWKAQNKSLVIFAGEAYNVEQGVSNELFPDERGEAGVQDPLKCQSSFPDDHTNFDATQPLAVISDSIGFANFMRFLAPPTPVSSYGSVTSASIANGASLFSSIGCAACHKPSMQTGNHSTTALANQTAFLFSDLLVHHMGALGDGISQGAAGPDEFRSAPLWGLGQRLFFLHDGRTSDLLQAIETHANGGTDPNSEANQVIINFNGLTTSAKQDILNFLRSL